MTTEKISLPPLIRFELNIIIRIKLLVTNILYEKNVLTIILLIFWYFL
jgi:hypothetical protein